MPPAQSVPILVYHHVYADGSRPLQAATSGKGVVAASTFRQQVDHLLEEGWAVVSTGRVVDWLAGRGDLPARAACLHFDNGWLDTATVVEPILRDLGVAATSFPITGSLDAASEGRAVALRTATEGRIEKPSMTWEQVAHLVDAGWEIGAHTATHVRLRDAWEAAGEAAVVREVETSHRAFERRLGFAPRHFAYPSGSRNEHTDAVLARYYDSLRLWEDGLPDPPAFTHRGTPPTALACQNIDMAVGLPAFRRLLRSAVPA